MFTVASGAPVGGFVPARLDPEIMIVDSTRPMAMRQTRVISNLL
jgi:hypothetical protein